MTPGNAQTPSAAQINARQASDREIITAGSLAGLCDKLTEPKPFGSDKAGSKGWGFSNSANRSSRYSKPVGKQPDSIDARRHCQLFWHVARSNCDIS